MPTDPFANLMGSIEKEYAAARSANEKRYKEAMAIYDEIITRYQPGGGFGKAALGQLEKQKVRETGAGMQQLISSGLYGTTTAAGLGKQWEEEVGAPSRLKLEDIMMQRLSQAQVGKAGFMERRQDVYPDVGALAGYAGQAAAAGGGGGGGVSRVYGGTQKWGTYGAPAQPGLTGGTGRGTSPGPGVASATVGFGPTETGTGKTYSGGMYDEYMKTHAETYSPEEVGTAEMVWKGLGRRDPSKEGGQYGEWVSAVSTPVKPKKPKTDMWKEFQGQIG